MIKEKIPFCAHFGSVWMNPYMKEQAVVCWTTLHMEFVWSLKQTRKINLIRTNQWQRCLWKHQINYNRIGEVIAQPGFFFDAYLFQIWIEYICVRQTLLPDGLRENTKRILKEKIPFRIRFIFV